MCVFQHDRTVHSLRENILADLHFQHQHKLTLPSQIFRACACTAKFWVWLGKIARASVATTYAVLNLNKSFALSAPLLSCHTKPTTALVWLWQLLKCCLPVLHMLLTFAAHNSWLFAFSVLWPMQPPNQTFLPLQTVWPMQSPNQTFLPLKTVSFGLNQIEQTEHLQNGMQFLIFSVNQPCEFLGHE